MWRSWLAHLLWEQRVLRSSRSTPTIEMTESFKTLCHFFMHIIQCAAINAYPKFINSEQGRYKIRDPALAPGLFCGERGIRTPGTETRTTV